MLKVVTASAIVIGGSVALAGPAIADTGDDSCGTNIICRLLPVAPDLDGDVDLSTQLPPAPAAPAPLPPSLAERCANYCS